MVQHIGRSKVKASIISEEAQKELNQFFGSYVGFYGLERSRVSTFLLLQLYEFWNNRVFDIYSVAGLMQAFDGVPSRVIAKEAERFRHPPMNLFWKAHFITPQSIVQNIYNHWGMFKSKSKKFEALVFRVAAEEAENPSPYGWQGRLAHEFTIEGYNQRAKQGDLTGEWLILGKHNSQNYYLCIARHSRDKKGDQEIYEALESWCSPEFPFLFQEAA